MKRNKRLFSKALFKQSCKANGMMWLIITLAVCFMLSCVMLISGSSNISSVKDGIQDTIIQQKLEAEIKNSAITVYDTTNNSEYIFDRAFAAKIDELNTKENYNSLMKIRDSATEKATSLVSDKVTEMVSDEVKKQLTAQVSSRVEEMVGKEVSDRLTQEVKAEVTNMVTTEVTKRLTNEVQQAVAAQSEAISADVKAAVSADMQSAEAMTLIQQKMTEGKDQQTATNEVIEYYTQKNKTSITNQYLAKAQDAIITDAHKAEVAKAVLTQYQEEYTATATAKIVTDAHKQEVINQVLAEKKSDYVQQAQGEIVTDANKTKTAQSVVTKNKDQYVKQAKNALSSKLDKISDEATDQITDLIKDNYIVPAYEYAIDQVSATYPEDEDETAYGAAMVAINPDNKADDEYSKNNEEIPEEYIDALTDYIKDDIMSWQDGKKTLSLTEYVESDERESFRNERAYNAVSMLIAYQMNDSENKQEILDKLSDYDVDEAKYDSMGFDYDNSKKIAHEAALEFQQKLNYEYGQLNEESFEDQVQYENEKLRIHDELIDSISGTLLDNLPEDVTDGIEELGTMDLYGLIVGSIFFKMAGLLLPIIYVIMAANNLVASQVDTGSMAYVLSTSTRRDEVTFTQALYLAGSTALMFLATTLTSCICFRIANVSTDLTYEKLLLINLGAFVTMFAISGINFFASCIFDRSKRAMALGGGISMFFLVATMLGLFGSPVIPSVVRIAPLNYFNYVSIISLFDVVSILEGTTQWTGKLLILVAIGIVGYITGSIHFKKKDLPL